MLDSVIFVCVCVFVLSVSSRSNGSYRQSKRQDNVSLLSSDSLGTPGEEEEGESKEDQ